MNVFLVSCVSKKKNGRAAAKDLYCSDWFSKARAYVQENGGCWYILSAKFGLLDPDRVIAPYNATLMDMDSAARKLWAIQVFAEFKALHPLTSVVTILAGQRYREFLLPMLIAARYEVKVPLAGKGIGQQLQWLKHNAGGNS